MSGNRGEKEKQKMIQEKCQQMLDELLRDDDNKYCVDCDAKGPRWASWNLGIFLCIRCAGIHRNLGVHISRVKSVNLDSWNAEQVGYLLQMGNSKARAVYEANLPDNFRRPQNDSALEAFIRSKYEQRKYIAKEWVQPPTPKPAFDIEEERRKEKEKKKTKIIPKLSASSNLGDVQTNPVPRPQSNAINNVKIADVNNTTNTNITPNNSIGNISSGSSNNINSGYSNTTTSNSSSKYSTDLLGLDIVNSNNDDDPFSAFVNASTQQNQAIGSGVKNEDEYDFFNQKAPEMPTMQKSSDKKLDKESILKLYQASNNPFGRV